MNIQLNPLLFIKSRIAYFTPKKNDGHEPTVIDEQQSVALTNLLVRKIAKNGKHIKFTHSNPPKPNEPSKGDSVHMMISDPDIFQVEEKVIYEWFLDSPSSSPFPTDGLQLQKILSSNLINASNRMFLIHSSLSILVCLLLSFIELNDTLSSNCNVSISRASLICRYVVYVGTKFYALSLWNLDMVQEQLQDRTRDINKRKTRIVYLACYDSSNINPFVGRTVLL